MPTMYITPEIIAKEVTAFLVYTPDGGGHYDAAIPHHIRKNMHELNSCCRCGSNQKNSTSQSCKPSPIYSQGAHVSNDLNLVPHYVGVRTVKILMASDHQWQELGRERGRCMNCHNK